MAITAGEIKYLLNLDPKNFLATLRKVQGDVETQRRRTEKPFRVSANVRGVVESLGKIGLAFNGLQQIYQTIAGPARAANRAFLEQDKSLRQLEGAAKLTGVALKSLQTISDNIKTSFNLTTAQANQFTVAANKLAQAAGTPERTEEILRRLFDLAAGQGLNAAEALLRFEQSIKGVDEGTEALFSGKNPIDLYKEFGKEIGVAATKMDDAQKKQAILNAIIRDGTKLQGEYTKFIQSAAGQQSLAANKAEELRAELGQLLNQVYIPFLQITTPILEAFTNLDQGTQKAGLALIGFIAVTSRVRFALVGLRSAFLALNASLGPAGVIIIGITALTSLLGIYAAVTDETTESMKKFNKELGKTDSGLEDYKKQVSDTTTVLAGLNDELDRYRYQRIIREQFIISGQLKTLAKDSKEYAAALRENTILEQERQELRRRANIVEVTQEVNVLENFTEKEIEELDKRREYEFETHRISTAQYISYLEDRRKILVEKLGEENVEYLKFVDRLNELRVQLKFETAEEALNIPERLEIRISEESEQTFRESFQEITDIQTTFTQKTIEELEQEFNTRREFSDRRIEEARRVSGEESEVYQRAVEERLALEQNFLQRRFELRVEQVVTTDFTAETFEELELEYGARRIYAELFIELAEDTFGRETEAYQAALEQRLELERNFQTAKTELAIAGARATIAIASQLVSAAQGSSKFLFGLGKTASIANAIINTYEAATKALAAYPPPFNAAAMAATIALGLAQVTKIVETEFVPPAAPGFGEGSPGPLTQADILQTILTPPGEHGIVAVRVGETIMNEQASRAFAGILKAMNEGRFSAPVKIQGFQAGGTPIPPIGGGAPVIPTIPEGVTKEDLERIIDAIRGVNINIRAELDAIQFLRDNYPRYEKLQKRRREV